MDTDEKQVFKVMRHNVCGRDTISLPRRSFRYIEAQGGSLMVLTLTPNGVAECNPVVTSPHTERATCVSMQSKTLENHMPPLSSFIFDLHKVENENRKPFVLPY